MFGRAAPLAVEIGFGMGSATAAIAAAAPHVDFVGIEVHPPGVGALLQRIDEGGLENVRIVQHDAVEVLESMIAPASLAAIHIFFPDPWHKKRHHKRRLIQAPFVRLLASRLAPGATLHCATDWQPYAEQMLAVLAAEPTLVNAAGAGFAPRPPSRPLTKFEQRGAIDARPRRQGSRLHAARLGKDWSMCRDPSFAQDDSAYAAFSPARRRGRSTPSPGRPGRTRCGTRRTARRCGSRCSAEPAHAQPRGQEREDEADQKERQVGGRQQRPLLVQAVGAGAGAAVGIEKEEAELGGGPARQAERHAADDRPAPERLVPGMSARHWQGPTPSASLGRISSTLSMRGGRWRRSAHRMTNAPTMKVVATTTGVNEGAP